MIDPVSACLVATKAFNTVKAMINAGREVESCLQQVSLWYGAVSDFNECKKQAENPPLFKRLVSSKSINQEAMDIYIQQKKIQKQESELRTMLLYAYGTGGYQELVDMRRKIKEQREKTVYAQARRRKAFLWNTLAITAIGFLSYLIYYIFKLIINQALA